MMVASGAYLFSNEIMNASHSSKFKQSELPKYDNAISDPMEHLIDFKSKLVLCACDGVLMCNYSQQHYSGKVLDGS